MSGEKAEVCAHIYLVFMLYTYIDFDEQERWNPTQVRERL